MKIRRYVVFILFVLIIIWGFFWVFMKNFTNGGTELDQIVQTETLDMKETENNELTTSELLEDESLGKEALEIETSEEETSEIEILDGEILFNGILEDEAKRFLSNMTLEEKVAQMFIVLPESIIEGVDCVTAAGEMTQQAINNIPVGGFVYLESNLISFDQTKDMLSNVQQYSMDRMKLPMFLCVDEEGGSVARISGNPNFGVPVIDDMADVGSRQDEQEAYEIGVQMGTYLKELGFNVDFAPVADVLTNNDNQVVRRRSFGSDPDLVSRMAAKVSQGLKNRNVLYTYKHFPGHGNTTGDTHDGFAFSYKTLEELESCELIPFRTGIENEVPFIMVGHISLPNVTGDNTPASLSGGIVNGLLRSELGYDGIVVTDALNMGAIAQQYSSSDAAVMAIQAGVDILLMPANFNDAYYGVINSVMDGSISEDRINESVERIIKAKMSLGIQ